MCYVRFTTMKTKWSKNQKAVSISVFGSLCIISITEAFGAGSGHLQHGGSHYLLLTWALCQRPRGGWAGGVGAPGGVLSQAVRFLHQECLTHFPSSWESEGKHFRPWSGMDKKSSRFPKLRKGKRIKAVKRASPRDPYHYLSTFWVSASSKYFSLPVHTPGT